MCILRRKDLIAILERALAQSAGGEVPYAPEAVRLLKSELEKRRRQP